MLLLRNTNNGKKKRIVRPKRLYSLGKLTKEAKQAEKAVKGLQTMIQNLEAQIYSYQTQLEEIDKSLASGKLSSENTSHESPRY